MGKQAFQSHSHISPKYGNQNPILHRCDLFLNLANEASLSQKNHYCLYPNPNQRHLHVFCILNHHSKKKKEKNHHSLGMLSYLKKE